MDIRKLQRAIVDGLEDVKAQNIAVFNTEHLSALFERVIIASGTSNRQTKSLASSVREAVKDAGYPVPRMEGEANGEWIVIDCGAAVVHVMQPTIRDYYHLEEIWGSKPVRLKIGGAAPVGLVKASERDDDGDADVPARRAPAKKARGATAAANDEAAATPRAARRRDGEAPADGRGLVAKAPAKTAAAKKAAGHAAAGKAGAGKTARPKPDAASPAEATGRTRAGAAADPRKPTAKAAKAVKPAQETPRRAARAPAAPSGVTRAVGVKGGAATKTVGAARGTPAPAAKKRPPARKRAAGE